MPVDQPECRDCGRSLSFASRFCPRCGLPVESLDSGRGSGVDVPPVGPITERSRRLIMISVIVGAALLGWSIINSSGGGAEVSASSTTARPTPSTSTTTTPSITATAEVVGATTTGQVGPVYVNGVQGPVLADGVEGVVFGVTSRRLTRIDLGNGKITTVLLSSRIDGEHLHIGNGAVLIFDGRFLHTVSLTTGGHLTVGIDKSIGDVARVAGSAGADSVWLVTEEESGAVSRIWQVDFLGSLIDSFEFDAPFRVRSAYGSRVYLDGPGGSWVFDTVTSSVAALKGEIFETNSDAIVLLTCESMLECGVSIDTGSGMASTSALTAADVVGGQLHIAPDFTSAFAHRYVDDPVEFTYIDLDTGDRVEFGGLSIDTYGGIIWVPDTSWIIARSESRTNLIAVNTDTGTSFELEFPGRGGGLSGSYFGLIPAV